MMEVQETLPTKQKLPQKTSLGGFLEKQGCSKSQNPRREAEVKQTKQRDKLTNSYHDPSRIGEPEADHAKPKRTSSMKMKKTSKANSDPPASQSAHCKPISSKPRQDGQKPNNKACSGRSAPSRAKSFQHDGMMSHDGSGSESEPISFIGADGNPKEKETSKRLPRAKLVSRSRSADGNNMPLKRIPRNPPRGIRLEKQPLTQESRRTSSKDKQKRRGGRKPEKSEDGNRNPRSHGSSHPHKEATQPPQPTSQPPPPPKKSEVSLCDILEKSTAETSASGIPVVDVDAFSVDFGTLCNDIVHDPIIAPISPSAATKETKPKLMMPSSGGNSESEFEESFAENDAGIVQFDPTATDNVKVVRQDSTDAFPQCAVEMEWSDKDNNKDNDQDHQEQDTNAAGGKVGLGFFRARLSTSGSFRFNKKKSAEQAFGGDAAAPLTTATSAMGAAVANLTKAWTTAGQGHQQLEGDDDV